MKKVLTFISLLVVCIIGIQAQTYDYACVKLLNRFGDVTETGSISSPVKNDCGNNIYLKVTFKSSSIEVTSIGAALIGGEFKHRTYEQGRKVYTKWNAERGAGTVWYVPGHWEQWDIVVSDDKETINVVYNYMKDFVNYERTGESSRSVFKRKRASSNNNFIE